MPCRSDYLEPTKIEYEYSRLLAIQEEIEKGKEIDTSLYNTPTHEKVYGKATHKEVNKVTQVLCRHFGAVRDMSTYSPEAQLWWKYHQRFDKKEGR